MGFLPNTRSHEQRIGKMCRKGWMCGCATFNWKRKRKKKFGVRPGKLSGRKDYRKVFNSRHGFVPLL